MFQGLPIKMCLVKILINDKLSISKTSITPFLLSVSRVEICWSGFRENVVDWKYITMLLHKEYYTIVLCYTGYWWQQTSRLLYVQSWRYIRKDQPTIEEENTFFFHFQPVCSPPWNVFAELVAFVKLTTKVIFMQSCGGNFDWFGLLWQFRVHEFLGIYITILSSIQFRLK